MHQSQKFIDKCLSWEGYLEKASKDYRYYESKTENAGYNNWQRFSRNYDLQFYGTSPVKDSYPWCATFICTNMIEAFGYEEAKRLMCNGNAFSAGCTQIHAAFANVGRWHTSNPQVGDLIIFGDNDHIGAVTKVDGSTVYTIEGNTSSIPGVEPNGGGCFRKSYNRSSGYILGYCRPDYKEEEEEVTQEQFNSMMNVYLSDLAKKEPDQWSHEARAWGESNKIINGADGVMMYKRFLTREEAIQLFYNLEKNGYFNK